MNLEHLFPQQEFTSSEITQLREIFKNETLRKYLKTLALNSMIDEIDIPIGFETSPEVYMRSRFMIKGQIALIQTLLDVSNTEASLPSSFIQE